MNIILYIALIVMFVVPICLAAVTTILLLTLSIKELWKDL